MFVAAEIYFFERIEFMVCSKFNHTQCGRTCACAVACVYPHNSISNVVVSLTIHGQHINKYIYIYIYQKCSKNMKPLRKVINMYIYIYMYIFIYIFICIYMYMCTCVCVSLCLLCGAVSRRLSRVVACYVLFVVRD